MSEPIQSISQGNYLLQSTVATSAGIVGDGSTQNPLRTDETVLWSGTPTSTVTSIQLSEPWSGFERVKLFGKAEGLGALYSEFETNTLSTDINLSNGGFSDWNSTNYFVYITIPCHFNNSATINVHSARYVGYWNGSWQAREVAPSTANVITKVIGVNRIVATASNNQGSDLGGNIGFEIDP